MVAAGPGVSLLYTKPANRNSADARDIVIKPVSDDVPSHLLVFAYDASQNENPTVIETARVIRGYFAGTSS